MQIAVIDNYDSFTFNLVHYIEACGANVQVFRNDELELDDLLPFDKLLLSPGPGLPKDAGLLMEIIKHYHQSKPILGICLGHQAIAEYFGGRLENLPTVSHGQEDFITVLNPQETLFQNIANPITVGRYHSWVVSINNFPDILEITSINHEDLIMSIQHKIYPIKGVQFHPESILTTRGKKIIENWMNN